MNIEIFDLASDLWQQTLEKLHHDVYHLPEYILLESKRTNTIPEAILITDGDKIFFVPYLLRHCDDLFNSHLVISEFFDVVSPYGYPGILLSEVATHSPEFIELAIEQLKTVLFTKNVCSAFFRLHPILNENLNEVLSPEICQVNGETVSVNLEMSEAEIWRQTRNDHRNKINWCKRTGMTAKMVPFIEYLDDFIEIYEETMNRVAAKTSYYFDYDYYFNLSKLGNKIHLCIVEWQEEIICAGLFTECCGIVQFHLSGTKNKFLKQAPSKLMLDYVRFWAKERGNKVFHLGGGVGSSRDSLYEFKAGFSKQSHKFLTIRIITDKEKYRSLVEFKAESLKIDVDKILQTEFFPAYRSPNIFPD
ncbi:FemAB family protein [Scytonema sp. PCC 10023]|uniref:FemAB family protein n=1 Tax=Scytonema sp. PCC 10023 TaxID=1680591 RepID=UPI0039C638EF